MEEHSDFAKYEDGDMWSVSDVAAYRQGLTGPCVTQMAAQSRRLQGAPRQKSTEGGGVTGDVTRSVS